MRVSTKIHSIAKRLPDEFALSKYLTYRAGAAGRKDRMLMTSDDLTETLYSAKLGLTCVLNKYDNFGELRKRTDMAIEALAFFESKYRLRGREIREENRDMEKVETEIRLALCRGTNWVDIPPPFMYRKWPRSEELRPAPDQIKLYFKKFDIRMFGKFLGTEVEHADHPRIFHQPDKNGIVKPEMMSLKSLCMRKLSTFNRVFGGDKYGPYTVISTNGLYPDKAVDLLRKYAHPTESMNTSRAIGGCLAKGLLLMYEYMGMTQHFGKLTPTISPDDVDHIPIDPKTASGLRQGDKISVVVDGVKYTKTPYGNKGVQEHVARERVKAYLKEWQVSKRVQFFEKACVICLKMEVFNKCEGTPEERKALMKKCREFFIPNIIQYMLACLVMEDRQMFERGRMIKIGMRWWHGGAQYMADQMKYKRSDMVYFDGDFKSLDTTIKKHLLELYATQARVYYNDDGDVKLFEAVLKLVTENLSVKMVHMIGATWKLILGSMPSGAKETSHGNSWIVGLLFFAYLQYLKDIYPDRANEIDEALKKGDIEFPVYGDDHVGGVVRYLSDIINEKGYANFVKKFFQMEITKQRENIPFLSVPNVLGNVKIDGVVFLKRRFIENKKYPHLPEVLPYKLFYDTLVKFGYGNTQRENVVDYIIAAIGMAYDSMGTNKMIYNFAFGMYKFCMTEMKYTTTTELQNYYMTHYVHQEDKGMKRLMRKAGITIEDIWNGFPTRQRLLNMHTYVSEYVNFTPPFGRYTGEQAKKFNVDSRYMYD